MHPGSIYYDGLTTSTWKESGFNTIELLVDNLAACETYRFSIEVTTVTSKRGGHEMEKNLGIIRNIILPPMAYVHNFRLPLLSKVSLLP